MVGRCRLTPGKPWVERACFQRSKLLHELLLNFAFSFNLRRYSIMEQILHAAVRADAGVVRASVQADVPRSRPPRAHASGGLPAAAAATL